ncbi:competence protein ComF [Coxiella burnetii]|uniref:ComF family protein n=1 Tax=Coxiella burnetii TaxID=777 RepID=UPI0003A57A7A|nr:ComF family protein [Coxiella burnetii]AML49604.1 competence protein ComF [Coxiella burnetii]AML55510.1 competence protein ComF [Coxiella burnetii]ATN69489.1 competence protein ComF [Coxiella burnetii]ATN71409.1 competence protein ComF [Coxiella burnetii]ATN73305.1 competence protein ComF [Coxiella burnetii]
MNPFIHYLIPPRCIFCCDFLNQAMLCEACRAALPWNENTSDEQLILFRYSKPIDRLITELKFHQKLLYARFFATCFIEKIKKRRDKPLPQALIPIPLHRKRLQKRGFNQALEIAKPIAKQFQLPLLLNQIERIKNTQPQTELLAKKRLRNVKNAFTLTKSISAKHVAILDNVITTGHTINELARTLSDNGVEKIEIWCCAKTSS